MTFLIFSLFSAMNSKFCSWRFGWSLCLIVINGFILANVRSRLHHSNIPSSQRIFNTHAFGEIDASCHTITHLEDSIWLRTFSYLGVAMTSWRQPGQPLARKSSRRVGETNFAGYTVLIDSDVACAARASPGFGAAMREILISRIISINKADLSMR